MQSEQRQRAINAFEEFLTSPLEERLQRHQHLDPQTNVLHLFKSVVSAVPAYRDFLVRQGIDASHIQTFADFQKLPLITKENYLRHYALPQLCRDGKLETCDAIAVSSGSTGKPTFWPRFFTDELQIATRFEQIFHDSFATDSHRTLAVICFTLGTWVGGIYTLNCCRYLASKGYPITVVAPGNNKEEIFRVIGEIGGEFDRVVLLGYPPFIKDVIDKGTLLFSGDNGIPLVRYHISDNGGIIPYRDLLQFLAEWSFNPLESLTDKGGRGIHDLPFVYVFGRSHFTVSYFGANIYPENVTVGLEQPVIRDWVTGKFVLQVKEDADRNSYLSVVVELAPGVIETEEMKPAIASAILSQLLRLNSEFANYVPSEYQRPQVTLTPTGDPEYFPVGVKHRYTRKPI
jgi:phenylacetate-coenzyme A ligase PaaK-like adenylate-forming protein